MIGLFLAASFALSLLAQSLGSPLAAAWLFPFLAACGVSLYAKGADKARGLVWWGALAWLSILGLSTFLIRPIPGAAATMWILAAAPLLVLCLRREHVKPCIIGVGMVLAVYAAGLILQEVLHVRYTTVWEPHSGRSWPVLDANNAAAILNFGVIGSFALALVKPRYALLTALLATGLALTHSRAGALAATIGCSVLLLPRIRMRLALAIAACAVAEIIGYAFPYATLDAGYSFLDRLPIWAASWKLVTGWGLGLGSFGFYYPYVRTETLSAGFYAHNDPLQILIEAGPLGIAAFLGLAGAVALTTSRRNLASAAILLAVFLQAMIEFQFYVPAVSILAGLALAYHRFNHDPAPHS